jgi:outer membrane protein assembly factor BamA
VNENTYYFQSFGYGLTWRGRKALWRGPGIERFDVLFGGNFSYQTPFENGPDRLIMQELPPGVRGGNTNYGIIGLMLEKRDSEFRPTTGYMLYTEFNAAHRITGSNFNLTRLTATGSAYGTFHFIRDITAAGRVGWMQTTGEVPYWMLSRLGGDGSLRGFPVNRFSDRHAVFYNAELRTWLWDWEDGLLRIGGQLFFDGGRVFPRGVPRGFFDDHHYVIGFGGAMSAFTPDFFIRGDVGFSKELYRIYISVGYAF